MKKMQQIDTVLRDKSDLDGLCETALDNLIELTGAKCGFFALYGRQEKKDRFVARGVPDAIVRKFISLPNGAHIFSTVRRSTGVIYINNINEDLNYSGLPLGSHVIRNLLGAPLRINNNIQGVVCLLNKGNGVSFNSDDSTIMEIQCSKMTHAIERNELVEKLRAEHHNLLIEKEGRAAVIRELKDAQNQLLQSEKMASIGQLAAGVAHEINNPVGYVYSNLGALREYIENLFEVLDAFEQSEELLPPESDAIHELKAVKKRVDLNYLRKDVMNLVMESLEGMMRVRQITEDLKSFSHADNLEWDYSDLRSGLDSALNIVNHEMKYKARVIREYGEIPKVKCLVSQLAQVFMNMLVNAAHAIEKNGIIIVRTLVRNEGWVCVEIEDTGSGMPKEVVEKIFDPFFTTKPAGTGTGLGLSLSYEIVKKHGGKIEVESTIGVGTKFRILIPVDGDGSGEPACNFGIHKEATV